MLFPASFPAVFVSFVLKGLGSTQAMYLSLAIPADVLYHQEALYGARTDGFTMTFYGGVLSGITGIATGLMNGLLYFLGYSASSLSSPAIRMVMPWLFIGGETICYACIFFLVMRLKAERYSVLDHMVIRQDQVLIENSMRFGQKRGGRASGSDGNLLAAAFCRQPKKGCEETKPCFFTPLCCMKGKIDSFYRPYRFQFLPLSCCSFLYLRGEMPMTRLNCLEK